MTAALVAVRALHFASAIVLFGQFAFACCVSPGRRPARGGRAIAAASLAVAIVTALAWLAIEAASMSGMPLGAAMREGMWRVVLERTLFGHLWILRGALALLLVVALAAMGAVREEARGAAQAFAGILAGIFLASLAYAGHAAGSAGADRFLHAGADGLHLLAAGGWLGTLLPFAMLLHAASSGGVRLDAMSDATRRFSALGMACVGTLALTGLVNACYAMRQVSALFTSDYGRTLLVKLVLFAAIVLLAAVNRTRLTPRLAAIDAPQARGAVRALARNAVVEAALGFAIVAIVGLLGITMPPMHAH